MNYYGTICSLAWIFGKYFYGKYYVWVAEQFYPYGLPNPKSSNPLRIYEDLYAPWFDRDDYDKFIKQSRLNIRSGVVACEKAGLISRKDATEMKKICDKVDILFFYPVVVRVDIDRCRKNGRTLTRAGSAAVGSHEYLIEDLQDSDFDLLFLDEQTDVDFREIVYEPYHFGTALAKLDVSSRLSKRC